MPKPQAEKGFDALATPARADRNAASRVAAGVERSGVLLELAGPDPGPILGIEKPGYRS